MKLYLDDDSLDRRMKEQLRKAGHDVLTSVEAGLDGEPDSTHLDRAIREGRVLLSRNHGDFRSLHNLVQTVKGEHTGILLTYYDNNTHKDIKPEGIVHAIKKLEQSQFLYHNQCVNLNDWR